MPIGFHPLTSTNMKVVSALSTLPIHQVPEVIRLKNEQFLACFALVLAGVTAKPQYDQQQQQQQSYSSSPSWEQQSSSAPQWSDVVQQPEHHQQQTFADVQQVSAVAWASAGSSAPAIQPVSGGTVSMEELQRRWASFLPYMPWLQVCSDL